MRFASALALVLILALAAACGDGTDGPGGPYTEMLRFTRASHDVTLNVEVADEPAERAQGLMNRESMPADAGMLFIWPEDSGSGFWMKGTPIPLSIAFVTAGGVVIDIQEMEPLSEELHHAPQPYRYAVEVNRGWFGENGVRVGDLLQLPVGASLPLDLPSQQESQPESTEATSESVTYDSGGLELDAYLCRPEGAGPFPAVIYNHGGLGDVIGGSPKESCESLAQSGFVGFSPIRRQTVELAGHIDDVLAAVDYVKALDYVDGDRLGMIGFSRGGLLTFDAATLRSDLQAFVVMAPAPGNGAVYTYLDEVEKVSAPVLILVSANDQVQADHVEISRQIEEALASAGKEARLIIYPPYDDDGHLMFNEIGDYWTDVEEFLRQRL